MNVMINFNEVTGKNRPKHNPELPQITNGYKLIHGKADIDRIFLVVKDLCKPKYQYLIRIHEDVGLKHFKYPNAFNTIFNGIIFSSFDSSFYLHLSNLFQQRFCCEKLVTYL